MHGSNDSLLLAAIRKRGSLDNLRAMSDDDLRWLVFSAAKLNRRTLHELAWEEWRRRCVAGKREYLLGEGFADDWEDAPPF